MTKEENGANSSNDGPELPEITSPTISGATLTLKPHDVQLQSAIGTTGKEYTMATAKADESTRAIRRSFSFRAEDVQVVLGDYKKKANHGSNILSFLKKTRRHA
uniref:Uncharacterized protein n=1 Tax=Arundo donax TaxID=35708 RepID=A0A0A9G0E7_ARUDO